MDEKLKKHLAELAELEDEESKIEADFQADMYAARSKSRQQRRALAIRIQKVRSAIFREHGKISYTRNGSNHVVTDSEEVAP